MVKVCGCGLAGMGGDDGDVVHVGEVAFVIFQVEVWQIEVDNCVHPMGCVVWLVLGGLEQQEFVLG